MKLAILDIRTITPAQLDSARTRMSRERQEQYGRLAHARARLLCVAADMAARQLVGDWRKDGNGKPICENGYLSIAHSGDYAVAVHSDRPIGIDIEKRRPLSPAVAKRIGDGGDPLTAWVKKEALGKALGVGVYRVLKEPLDRLTDWKFSLPAAPEGYLIAICEKQEP